MPFYLAFKKAIKFAKLIVANENTSHLLLLHIIVLSDEHDRSKDLKCLEKVAQSMSYATTPMTPNPNPMKKKVLSALVAVVIGHVGVIWAISHMQSPELKPIEKEPLKVRFVQIKDQPKPLPPEPKAEPKKQQPAPPKEVKEVKVVETPPPPKKVEVVQQVKKPEAIKPVTKPVEAPVTPKVTTTVTETVTKPAPVAAPVAPPAPPAPPSPPAPPAPAAPKAVSIGGSGVQWSRSPRPTYTNRDLQGETRHIVVLIEADEKGNIVQARVTRSSGVAALDDKILRAVRSAKFKPYKENGVAYPIRAEQPFELTLNPNG